MYVIRNPEIYIGHHKNIISVYNFVGLKHNYWRNIATGKNQIWPSERKSNTYSRMKTFHFFFLQEKSVLLGTDKTLLTALLWRHLFELT